MRETNNKDETNEEEDWSNYERDQQQRPSRSFWSLVGRAPCPSRSGGVDTFSQTSFLDMIGMRQKSFHIIASCSPQNAIWALKILVMDFPTGIMRPGTKTIWLLDLTSAMSYGPANLFFFEIFTLELCTCSLWLSGTPFAFIHLDPLFWDPYTLNFVRDRIFPESKILKLSSCDSLSRLIKMAQKAQEEP